MIMLAQFFLPPSLPELLPHIVSSEFLTYRCSYVPRRLYLCRFAVNSFVRKWVFNSISARIQGTFSPAMSVAKNFSRSTVRHDTKKTFTGCLASRRTIKRRCGDAEWSAVVQSSRGRKSRGSMLELHIKAGTVS